jgi:hypothetical protein
MATVVIRNKRNGITIDIAGESIFNADPDGDIVAEVGSIIDTVSLKDARSGRFYAKDLGYASYRINSSETDKGDGSQAGTSATNTISNLNAVLNQQTKLSNIDEVDYQNSLATGQFLKYVSTAQGNRWSNETLGSEYTDNMATADLSVDSARDHSLNAQLLFSVEQGGEFKIENASDADRLRVVGNGVQINGLTYPTTDGADGEILTTNGAGTLSFAEYQPKTIAEEVKNVSGGTLTKGTPVHITGSVGNLAEVIAADAATNYPAHFVLSQDLADDGEGLGIALGFINNVDVPDASIYTEGQTVYLGASGGWVTTKPTGTNAIQNLGIIIKVNTSGNKISGIIMGAGRANDVPNIPEGQTWIGNASGVATPTTLSDVATSGAYSDLSGTPSIPASGVDFDPVGTDNSTDVTLAGAYNYLTLAGQQITLGQVDYATDISNTPTIPTSGVDFDPVGTDNSTDVSVNANATDVLRMQPGQILGSQDAGADKLVFWDDSEGKLTYATIGTNLTMTADTLSASGGGGANMSQSFTAPTNVGEFQDGARLVTDAYGTAPSATAGTLVSFGASNVSAVGAQSNAAAATGMLTFVTDAASGDELLVEGVIKLSTATTTTLLPTTAKKGSPVYMSTTAGAVTNTAPSTAGDFVRVVGHVVDAANRTIYFKPDNTWLEL